MGFDWGGAMGAAAGLAGSALGVWGQSQTNALNAKEAQKNRDWQERMSNTAHQREVSDLRAAGLNPILSATGGSGASVGHGAQATMINPLGEVAEGIHNARRYAGVERKQLSLQKDIQDAQIARERSTADLNASNTALSDQQRIKTMLDQRVSSALELKTLQDVDTSRYQANALAAAAGRDGALSRLYGAQALNVMADTDLKKVDLYGNPNRVIGGILDGLMQPPPGATAKSLPNELGQAIRGFVLPQ